MVSLMTALWFAHLEAPDRVSVKPHASPVLHAINYLLGRLDRELPDDAARVRRAAVLPQPHEGPGPGRLLHRLGRPRRDRADLGRARPPLRGRALRRAARRPPDRADRRRRARRGRLLGGDRRPDGGQARRGHVGRRPQPPVARPRGAGHRGGPAGGDVRGGRLALRHGQVRRRRLGRAARALRERIDAMPNEEYQRLLRADAAELRERLRGRRLPGSTTPSCTPPSATSAATTSARCSTRYREADAERDRPSVIFAYTIKGWSLPTEGHPANHSALLTDEQFARAGRGARHRPRATRGRPSRTARRRPSCARRRRGGSAARAGARRRAAARSPPTSAASTAARESTQQAFGRFFVDLRARRPRWPSGSSPSRPTSAPRPTSAAGSTSRDLVDRRPHRLVRRRHRHARALARDRPRPAHRAGHRRGQPRRPARRARRHVVARRPAAAAGRHDLRPVRLPRAGAVVVRHLRRRPVDPRRHAERASRSGPRAARTSRSSRRRSGSSSRAARPGSPPSGRTSSGPCCTRSSRLGRPDGASAYLRLSTRPIDQSLHDAARARRCSPAATGCARPTPRASADRGHGRAGARGDRGGRVLEEAGVAPRSCASPAPTCCSAPSRPAPGSARATRDPRRLFPQPRRRSSRCSTAIRTRSPSWPRSGRADRLPRRAALRPVGRHRASSTSTTRSTPSRWSAPRWTCLTA